MPMTGQDQHLSHNQIHALKTLKGYEENPGHSMWPHVDRFALIRQLEDRVRTPSHINQKNTGWCGPAAVLESMATDAPNTYVKMVLDLLHHGHATVHHGHLSTIKLTTTATLRHYAFGGTQVASADWVPLSTIRESVKYAHNHSQAWYVKNGTYPADLVRFYRELGYSQVHNHTSVHNFVGPLENQATHHLNNHFGHGFRVSMFINDDLLYEHRQNNNVDKHPTSVKRNHYVDLISQIAIQYKHPIEHSLVAMHIFSWGSGDQYSIPFHRKLTLKAFASNFFGFVGARY